MDLEHERRLADVEARAKSNSNRLDKMEERQDNLDDLVGTVKALAVREENVEKDVKEIKTDVKNLSSKPGERWERLGDKILMTVIGIIVGYIFTKLGF